MLFKYAKILKSLYLYDILYNIGKYMFERQNKRSTE